MTATNIVDPSLKLAGQFFATGTQHASVAMRQWTHGQVKMTLDEVMEVPLEEAAGLLDGEMDLLTMVVVGVEGAEGSQLILTFNEEHGRKLASALTGRQPGTTPEWSPLEQSAVMETGNILGSAYLNELTRLTNRELKPSAPYFVQDFGASVLQQALMMQALTSDHVSICQTRFEFNDQKVNWNVFFVPSQELVDAIGRVAGEV